jgi:[ribosomal protein S5]-alanine N-acetyltransferase
MTLLETENLILRKLRLSDASFMLELLNTPLWLKFIGDRGVKSIEDAEKYLLNGSLKSYRENGFGFYCVEEKSSKKAIGMCGYVKRDELKDVDFGFAFLPEFIGKGYGFEIAKPTLDFGKSILKFERITAIVNPENIPSNNLLKKLGFVFEKTIEFSETKVILNLYGV